MKYVVLSPLGTEFLVPVFCVSPMTHREVATAFAATHRTVSAGFCEPAADGTHWRVYGRSESLNLGPGRNDGELITALVHATRRVSRGTATAV